MADPMQQARELLAAEYEKVGAYGAAQSLRHNDPIWTNSATLKAISNALQKAEDTTLRAAPEGFVLVPELATEDMLVAGFPHGEIIDESFDPQGAWADMLAARPQGVR